MEAVEAPDIVAALQRATDRMMEMRDLLNRLDAALGDGDTGIYRLLARLRQQVFRHMSRSTRPKTILAHSSSSWAWR